MPGLPSPFGGDDDSPFDSYDEFAPDHAPDPGAFLDGADVLTGRDHVAFHRLTRALFEARTVYDMTFGYNLARLNLDTRHPGAGYRYAVERDFHRLTRALFEARTVYDMTFGYNLARLNLDTRHPGAGYRYAVERDGRVLRAEFTPTTPFCPQTRALTVGSFRAWNGLADRHEYDLVRVRAAPMHQQSEAVNDELADLEAAYRATGEVPTGSTPAARADQPGGAVRDSPETPF